MVWILLLISNFPSLLSKPLGDYSKDSWYHLYHRLIPVLQRFLLSSKVQVFIFLHSFIFTLSSAGTGNSTYRVLFLFLVVTGWNVCISKFLRILWVSFFRTGSGLCVFVYMVNFNLLHNSQWITFPKQPYSVLYSFFCFLWKFYLGSKWSWYFTRV